MSVQPEIKAHRSLVHFKSECIESTFQHHRDVESISISIKGLKHGVPSACRQPFQSFNHNLTNLLLNPSTMSTPTKHLAAVMLQKGEPFSIVERPTPTPGPQQLLVQVRAAAVTPADWYQREHGLFIETYPSVTGWDISGVVVEVGSDMHPNTPEPGTRVVAHGSGFVHNMDPDYGAYQEYALVDEENVAVLPDSYSFVEGSVFPMTANTTWNAWLWAGIPRDLPAVPEKQALLVWGASSSIGSFAVQQGKLMGFEVYATASPRHHEYLKTLGATRLFDYSSDTVREEIVAAVKGAGVTIRTGLVAAGSQQFAVDVINETRGDAPLVKLAIAPILDSELKVPDGVETAFVYPPQDETVGKEQRRWVFTEWLQGKLAARALVPSPHIKVVEGGLQAANKALDEWKEGVSATKLVIEL